MKEKSCLTQSGNASERELSRNRILQMAKKKKLRLVQFESQNSPSSFAVAEKKCRSAKPLPPLIGWPESPEICKAAVPEPSIPIDTARRRTQTLSPERPLCTVVRVPRDCAPSSTIAIGGGSRNVLLVGSGETDRPHPLARLQPASMLNFHCCGHNMRGSEDSVDAGMLKARGADSREQKLAMD